MLLLSKKKKLQNSSPRGFVQATTNFSSFIVQEVFAGSSVGDGGHFCTRVANFLPPKFLPCHCNCRNSKWLFASSLFLSYTYVQYTILCTLYLCRLSNSTTSTFYLVVTLCSMNRVHCPLSPASKLCQMLLAAATAAPLYTKMFIFVQLWAYLVIICSYSSRIISTDVYSTHICHNIR